MAKRVVVVAAPDAGAEVGGALSSRGFLVANASPEQVAGSGAEAVVLLTPPGVAPAGVVARLLQSKPCPPVVVRLSARDNAVRDQCIIQGAADVSFGSFDELAACVEAAVSGWSRESSRRPLSGPLRAQRGRQPLTLEPLDLDATGIALQNASGLNPGELVRFVLPLPGGDLVTWGRVSSADAAPGVRFLGLGADDVDRIRATISAPATPAFVAPPGAPEGPAAPPAEPAPAAPVAAPASPAAAPSAGTDIAAALSEIVDGPPPAASEADVLAGLLNSALVRKWPAELFDREVSLASLKSAALTNKCADAPQAPPGAVVLAFAKSLTSIERRAFEPAGITDFGEPALALRCLGLRLRLVALVKDGEKKLVEGSGWVVDEPSLQAMAAEVKAADADLQKVIDGRMAKGDTAGIKDVTTFRNALNRAMSDVKGTAARMKGEEHHKVGSAVLLDVAERDPNAQPATWRKEAAKEPEKPKAERKLQVDGGLDPRPGSRRKALVAWAVGMAALVGFALYSWPDRVDVLGAKELQGMPGVVSVLFTEGSREGASSAVVRVEPGWKPAEPVLNRLREIVRARGAKSFVVSGPNNELFGVSGSGPSDEYRPLKPTSAK